MTGTIVSGTVTSAIASPAPARQSRFGCVDCIRIVSAVDSLGAGERCALNVVAAELDRSQVGRGDWLVAPGIAV